MRSMNREELGVFLDATQKVCSFCNAVNCDTCQVSKLVEKYKNIVDNNERQRAEAEWIYETGREEPEILGSGSREYNVVRTKDEAEAFRLSKESARNYISRSCVINGKRIYQWWDGYSKKWIE